MNAKKMLSSKLHESIFFRNTHFPVSILNYERLAKEFRMHKKSHEIKYFHACFQNIYIVFFQQVLLLTQSFVIPPI